MKRIAVWMLCLLPLMAMGARKVTWVIDPGHGGHDYGCEGKKAKEKDICLAIAKEVGSLVKKNISGVRIIYTREKDTYPTLSERCTMANVRGAELFLSIHVNSAPNRYVRGTESFYATNVPLSGTQAGKSELLALLLQRQYMAHGRDASRGVKQRELYVCENTNMPSVLTEVGFITNADEEIYLTSKAGQKELAQAIYKALAEYQELTKDGVVDKRKLRNLRYSAYAPLAVTTPKAPVEIIPTEAEKAEEAAEVVKDKQARSEAAALAKAEAEARAKREAEEAAAIAKAEAEAKAKAEAEAKARAEAEVKAKAEAEAKAKAEAEAKAKAEAAAKAKAEAEAKAAAAAKAEAEAKAKAEADAKAKAEAEAKAKAEAEAAAKAKAEADAKAAAAAKAEADAKAKAEAEAKAAAAAKAKAEAEAKAKAATNERPYFAIQLMNTAAKLKDGDYRLKGYTGVRYVPAGERFKVIYSRATDYQEIKNELAQVRETFPEAFIVAFLGDRQITTAEALELLKK